MQEDLRVGDDNGTIPVNGDDRSALHVRATVLNERLLTVALDHGHHCSRAFKPGQIRLKYPAFVPERSRLLATPGIDRRAPTVDQA